MNIYTIHEYLYDNGVSGIPMNNGITLIPSVTNALLICAIYCESSVFIRKLRFHQKQRSKWIVGIILPVRLGVYFAFNNTWIARVCSNYFASNDLFLTDVVFRKTLDSKSLIIALPSRRSDAENNDFSNVCKCKCKSIPGSFVMTPISATLMSFDTAARWDEITRRDKMAWWNKILEVVIKNVCRYHLMVPYRNLSCGKHFTNSR